MVPEGWTDGRVLDFFKLQRGYDLTKAQSLPGPYPVYSSSGISYRHAEAKVQPPGVVTGRKGSVGPVYFIEEAFWPHDTSLWVSDFKGSYPKFIWYFLLNMRLERFDEASSVPTLNRNNVHRRQCIFPPVPEQRKIADILSTWDEAIEKSEALLTNARTQKRALMQQLLTGKRRFPEFEGQPWKEVRLGDVVSGIRGGGTPDKSNPDYWGGELPWVSVKDLKANTLERTIDTITEESLKHSAANAFPSGTIIVATRMAVGTTVRLGSRMAINQDLKAVLPSDAIENDFLYHQLKRSEGRLEALGTGSTVKGITLGDLRNLRFWLPISKTEQSTIASLLDDIDTEVASLTEDITKLRIEKKALMQQLLTGKRRVAVDA